VQQRDYRLALSRATDANERALEAARQAANGKARARGDAEAAATHLATSIRQMDERLKVAESIRPPLREVDAARRLRADADKALQEARAAIGAGSYLAAIASTKGQADRIAAGIRTLNEAIDSRSGRAPRRRR
jgi:hypothetical protein